MTNQQPFASANHAHQTDLLRERAIERYDRACKTARYGSTPAIRAAAVDEAQRLLPLVHNR